MKLKCNSSQEQMWILSQFEGGSVAYNNFVRYSLPDIKCDSLLFAFEELVSKNPAMRAVFRIDDNRLVQVIGEAPDRELWFQQLDLSTLTAVEAEEIIRATSTNKFNLETGPLFTVRLLKMPDGTYNLLFCAHHIITDGVSFRLIFNQVFDTYKNHVKGGDAASVDYTEAYANCFTDQADEKYIKNEAFWKKELGTFDTTEFSLFTDHDQQQKKTFKGKRLIFELDEDITKKLKVIAFRNKSTLFCALYSIYSIFLRKITNCSSTVSGTVLSGRTSANLDVIGNFIKIVPVTSQGPSDQSFSAFLKYITAKMFLIYEHQDYNFNHLVDLLKIRRTTNKNPLFENMFILQEAISEYKTDTLEASSLWHEKETSIFELLLEAYENKGRLCFTFEYDTVVYKEDTISRFASIFSHISRQIAHNQDIALSDVSLQTLEEEKEVLALSRGNRVNNASSLTLIGAFIRNAENDPGKTALIYGDQLVSFGELLYGFRRSQKRLIHAGVKKGDIIGLVFSRSPALFTDILAIIGCGAAYLPIDPQWPLKRINAILTESGCRLVLIENRSMIDVTALSANYLVHGEYEGEAGGSAAPVDLSGSDLFNVIYTSGSTGAPKGVMVEHHSILNRLLWGHKHFNLRPDDVLLFKTRYTFDVSIPEIFTGLLFAVSSCILPSGQEGNPAVIVETIFRNNVTSVHFVPSMLSLFLDHIQSAGVSQLSSLRRVFASGEALSPGLVRRFNDLLFAVNGTVLYNLYGPTEAAVEVSSFTCSPFNSSKVYIGKPIDNADVYVLGSNLSLQPNGIPGEIYISGIPVARGYLKNADLTSAAFIIDPYLPDQKMYKTGDKARRTADGNIEYMGRSDSQVKISGFRIELAEIEEVVRNYPSVTDCVCVAKTISGPLKTLIVYFIASESVSTLKLRGRLRDLLPQYAIPSHLIQVESIPLTTSGKADRKLLESLDIQVGNQNSFIAPSTPLEIKIARIWQAVLPVKEIGMNSDFFSLGGNSLMAVKAILLIKEETGAELNIVDFINARLHYIVQLCEKKLVSTDS